MRELLRRIRFLLRHRQLETDLAEEIETHRAMAQRVLEDRGVAHDVAAAAARRAVGNDLSARDRARDVWVAPWLQDIAQDVRFAARLLVKDPWFTATAVLALGIGTGVNGAMFALFNAYGLAGVPIDQPERVIYIETRDTRAQERGISYAEFEDMRRASWSTVSSLAAFGGGSVSLGDEGRAPDRVFRAHVSAEAFGIIGGRPVIGRDFRSDDDRAGAPPTVILSSKVWKARYASDGSIVGRTVTVNGVPTAVIGVMPDGFKFPNQAEAWQPLSLMPGAASLPRDARTFGAYARLVDGSSVAQAAAELGAMAARLADEYPATNDGIQLTAVPINSQYNADITQPAWAAFVTAGILIVLIACANVANLLLTRSVTRSREIAIRASLGATRRRVVRQLLVESALLSCLGAVFGLAVAQLGLLAMTAATPERAIPYSGFTLDGVVLAVFTGISCAMVFLFGMAPAVMISKTDVNRVLKEGGRGTSGPGSRRWTTAFLTAELAVTVLLLLMLVGSYRNSAEVARVDQRIDTSPLLTALMTLPAERYATAEARLAFHNALSQRLSGVGEVSVSATASLLPLGGGPLRQIEIDGRTSGGDAVLPIVSTVAVSPRYFEALRLPILRGRAFEDGDGRTGYEAAIVNQRFVDLHFPDADPLGRRVRLKADASSTASPSMVIVGVAQTVRQRPQPDLEPIVYVPIRASVPATAALIVRAAGNPVSLAALLRDEVRALDRDLPLYRVMTMEQAMADLGWNARVSAGILLVITLVALGLSAVGLYAVTAYGVTQRTAEIGIRIALGANPWQVRLLVVLRAARQGVVGAVVGLGAMLAWNRFFFSRVASPGIDAVTVVAVVLLVSVVVVLASVVPVRRATRLDPINALRHE